MNADQNMRIRKMSVHLCAVATLALCFSGCGKPNQSNITVRKENQSLREQVDQLTRDREADKATIRSLQASATTVPVLPDERVGNLFTVHGIRLNRLTGGADLDPKSPGDDALKVYVEPYDQDGQALKAAGAFVVEAFDLAAPEDQVLVGRWKFDVEQTRRMWYGSGMLYEYVLTAPLERAPAHPDITVKVSFFDELTRRQFDAQKVVKINIPSPPGAAPSAAR